MALNLDLLNKELIRQFDIPPFHSVMQGTECETWVRGRDGVNRRVWFTMEDVVTRDPIDFVGHIINMLIAASQAGAPKPFCLHCGREY